MSIDFYDQVCLKCSSLITRSYSTSFSFGIFCFPPALREPIYSIYGFVRFADEIVDTFHEYDKKELLEEFKKDTYKAIGNGISLNPVLHNFQKAVNTYEIDHSLINQFLKSMEMDLKADKVYDEDSINEYILGSAEVVGLMCLKVFCAFGEADYEKLKPSAMSLGAAFQKVNFLRDLKADYEELGRTYFPGLDLLNFSEKDKNEIELAIEEDFRVAYEGIRQLPPAARFGVYTAYLYYLQLFKKICNTPPHKVMRTRIRIPNQKKVTLLFTSYIKHRFNFI
ncbi:MAG: phytoene/squalene synthase family protein [Candidatus Cyclobacteriaceae bacterium M2_1C_046]